MSFSYAGSILATLTQTNNIGLLADRVKNLPVAEFVALLDFITAEFQQFIRAIDLLNNEGVETLLEQMIDAFTLKIGQALETDHTHIFLVNLPQEQLWSKTLDPDTGKAIEIRLPLNIGILGYAVTTGKTINVPDAKNHPLFNPEVDELPDCRTESILCMPILGFRDMKEVVAVVRLLNKKDGLGFTEDDENQFRSFADSIGIILESCQALYVAARNQKGVAAILKATTSLGQSLDLETTLRSVMEQARDLMQADRSTLFLLSKETSELWTKVASADGKSLIEVRISANKGIAGYVASTGQTLNITDAYNDPRFDPSTDRRTGYETRNILCMPVYNAKGELIGVTQLINKYQGSFTPSDEQFLRAFNAQAGIALQNSQLFENVLVEKQHQKDILQSLSDVVISTDLHGRIVTINEAALDLLGCPIKGELGVRNKHLWEEKLVGRYVWEIMPLDHLRFRLEDSLRNAARHYVPEQTLTVGVFTVGGEIDENETAYILAIPDRVYSDLFIPWGETDLEKLPKGLSFAVINNPFSSVAPRPVRENINYPKSVSKSQVKLIERSLNLTVNPLTNPEGGVRGGLVVLEDISREKRLKTTMYRYMTPGVAEQVMALGEDALMVGERKDVTILFCDIRNYTNMTENLGASEVVTLLNEYFETMVEAVFFYEGTLDKFMGDALMAVFGAPIPLKENHAWLAVQSALDMRHRLVEFNHKRAKKSHLKIGIGISSGEVVAGNIGSQKRMDYTVIGDSVNLSSRLEGVTKEYGCDIVLSETTYNLCGDRIWVRELDKIRVKGKNQAVSIYELIGDRNTPLDEATERFLELYNLARIAYMARDFDRSLELFTQVKSLRPNDQAVNLHIERIGYLLQNQVPEDWDGVRVMITK
jgi:adenylate cyclase